MSGAFLFALCCATSLPAWAATRTTGTGRAPETEITMNYQNVDIPALAKLISEITGKNFLVDESVRGKVTIISPSKVTPEQAYQIFQSVLQLKGFTTEQAGKVIKIIPSRNVRQAAPVTESQQPFEQHGDEYVTRLVKLRNVDASAMVSVIQPMISHDGLVAAFPDDNTIIITDDAYNVERLLKIIGSLDIEGQRQSVELIPLRYAFADELAPEIDELLGGSSNKNRPGAPGQGVVAPSAQAPSISQFKVLADERTNSIIAAGGPLQMKKIRELVDKLDIRSPDSMHRIHVYRLKNAAVSEMIEVLGGLLGGGGGVGSLSPTTGRGSLGRGSGGGGMMNSGFGGMGGGLGGIGGGMGSMGGIGGGYGGGGFGGGSSFGGGMMGGSSFGSSGSFGSGGRGMGAASGGIGGGGMSSMGGGGGSSSTEFSRPVKLTADPATNSLVVSAAPQDWEVLRSIIAELDVPRTQVFVQAIIVEVSAERSRDMGVSLQASTAISNSVLGLGTVDFGQLQNVLGNPLGVTGLGLGLASGSLCSIPAAAAAAVSGVTTTTTATSSTVPCDVALVTALEMDTHSNVLSAPTLLTADNEEATIVVGENLPFVGSSAANAGLPGQIFNSIERQNVGITLDIVPQVSDGDYVRMDMYEEVSNVVASTANNANGPTTTIRSASTTVLVQNHRTAVIGGLMSNNDNYSRQGIPWISDIPVLGNFFSDTSSDKMKDNLLIFLTPHVVRNKTDLRALALDQRSRFVNSLGPREMKDMPASSIRSMYDPSFSVAVPPAADLNMQNNSVPPPGAMPEGDKATPFNTEEIPAPSSSSGSPGITSPPPIASASPGDASAPPSVAAADSSGAPANPEMAAPDPSLPAAPAPPPSP
ncbi:MAG TPA: type II secretion system secretin GspD [Candidatus Binataceae bacterium]|nr:type II secretion system secretin GspD [Candidatus Binataceae bacterium]